MSTEESRGMTARECTLKMLLAVYKDKQFSHTVKGKYLEKLEDKRERALATRMFEGCIERGIELDYIINLFSKTPVKKMKPVIAAILRMTVYQLRFMDKIPDGAACNEAVKLAKKYGFAGLSGFVNGVARSVARAEKVIYPEKTKSFTDYLSVTYSMPTTIVEQIVHQYGEETAEQIFATFLSEKKPLSIRCMKHSIHVEELATELRAAGITVEPGNYSEDALLLYGIDTPERLPGFSEGAFYIQDESSMQAVLAAGLTAGDKVLDLCASPGGKTIMAADVLMSHGNGKVYARDVSDGKVALIRENVERCGLTNVLVSCKDATCFYKEDEACYDVVLADVPCSGLGIIGKKPDIKLFMTEEQQQELCVLQKDILQNAVRYVKPGGVLVFSTCTLNKDENMGGFYFLKEQCGMVPESLEPYIAKELWTDTTEAGYLQMLPGVCKTDGFFVARFRKKT